MKDQDRRAVEGMARCGLDLEGLIAMFPGYPADEVTEVYREINKIIADDSEDITISINCS